MNLPKVLHFAHVVLLLLCVCSAQTQQFAGDDVTYTLTSQRQLVPSMGLMGDPLKVVYIQQFPFEGTITSVTPIFDDPRNHHMVFAIFREDELDEQYRSSPAGGYFKMSGNIGMDGRPLLIAAAPGYPVVFPENAGVYVPPKNYLVIMYHFYNMGDESVPVTNVTDASGIRVTVSQKKREHEVAYYFLETDPSNTADIVSSHRGSGFLPTTVHVFALLSHSHMSGAKISFQVMRDGDTYKVHNRTWHEHASYIEYVDEEFTLDKETDELMLVCGNPMPGEPMKCVCGFFYYPWTPGTASITYIKRPLLPVSKKPNYKL